MPDAPTRRDDTGPLLGAASPGPSHPPAGRAAEADPGDEAFVGPDDPSSPRRLPWAELLRRVHRTDVLTCPRCHGPRTVLAYLSEPAVTSRILEHLCLPATPPRRAPARAPPDHHPGLPGWTDDAFVDPPAPSD